MLISLIVFLLFYIPVCLWYFKQQNNNQKIGGKISMPKMLWLSYALFTYFFLSLWLLYFVQTELPIYNIIIVFAILIYARFVFQGILQFVIKKWIPPMGIFYNIFCSGFLIISLFGSNINLYNTEAFILFAYAILVLATLLTDTFYAYRFYKIVGSNTKGNEAIWYASEVDPVFNKINYITKRLNIVFYIALTLLVVKTLLAI